MAKGEPDKAAAGLAEGGLEVGEEAPLVFGWSSGLHMGVIIIG